MPRSLADYDSDRGQYARPEQPWVCGRACDGSPCYIGPDQAGHCQVHLECVPLKRGDRWQCTRPKAAGGKCADGPLPDGSCSHCPAPCQPKRSLLARRRVLTVFVASAALGSLLLLAGGESNKEFLSPGPLSVHHHALQLQCSKCHTAEEGHAVLKTVGAENALHQSRKCIECHHFGEKGPNEAALHPHGIAPGRLSIATHRIKKSAFHANPPAWTRIVAWGPGIPKNKDEQLACAVCHQEHRGARHDLKQISERRCQVCHEKTFHAFSQDHPEFTNYPYQRRTRIHFDHSSHYGRHFGVRDHLPDSAKPPQSCNACHTPDPSGAKMLVRGFEQSCASCHGPEIQLENKLPGVPFFALPALDERALKWADVKIGRWPRTASPESPVHDAGPTASLPPFMLLLLNGNEKFRKAAKALADVTLSRLPEKLDADRRKDVKDYVDAVRRLLRDLQSETGRLETLKSAGIPLTREMRAAVASPRSTGALLADAVRAAESQWFPTNAAKPPAAKRFGNWNLRGDDFSIRYRPRLHADPFLRFWLERSAKNFARQAAAGSSRAHPLGRLFRQLSDPATPGSCAKCHTVDQTPSGDLKVNWDGFRPKPFVHRFTRFSHQPHLKELGQSDKACATCHVRDTTVNLLHPKFTHRDWLPNVDHKSFLTSGFAAMKRQDCAKCHTPKIAGQNCLQCHNYHVGRFPPRE